LSRAYLDHASTSPARPEVVEAMLPWLSGDHAADPGRVHTEGRMARMAIEDGREKVAALLPDDLHWRGARFGTMMFALTEKLSPKEASFTVEDEGEGFDIREIPDPCDPANLFRTSGRGVLLIYNIMDEVEYNAQGNRVKMIKRPELPVEAQLVDPNVPDDKHA